ncbi:myo-inositol 2-dehydrogenase [Arthrobacter alpinus]|uniref:Myo-inositol 2-dehydrogenase n=1 Tax=Arthrobacter alpinus TaxID=656366 RepID=A0A1H5FDU9_9MICC|nr:Gfo/Idh/MocA family oxidoreductase [Arthrobacter alpinus]SEE01576.1 myo-inositol 2-dehydrogenase [Arthrobacter alpinus]
MTQLRIGLIGAGGIASVHIAGWQQQGAHVSVYSRSGAAHLVQQYGITEVATLAELLAASDMVSILTPTTTHHEYAMAAIAAGKDVICEKPLAENTQRAAEMLNAAHAARVRLFPAHVVRFFPEYVAAKAQLSDGPLPAVLHLSRSSAAPAAGSWFFDESLGGGIVPDQMIHDIDQALWLAGDVQRVFAVQNPPSVDGILPRPVNARIVLMHGNGVLSRLSGEWGPDGLPFSTSITVEAPDGSTSYSWPESEVANAPGDYLPAQSPASSPYTLQIAEFAAARASGQPSRVSAFDGVMAVALAEAAAASIKSGEPVEFSVAAVAALLDGDTAGVEL